MPVGLRVLLFGLFWFGIFWMALMVVCGGIASSSTKVPPPPPGATVQHGAPGAGIPGPDGVAINHGVAADFNERYGVWIMAGAAVLAAAGTWAGILPGTRRK